MNIETLVNQLRYSQDSVKLSDTEYIIEEKYILHLYFKKDILIGFEIYDIDNVEYLQYPVNKI